MRGIALVVLLLALFALVKGENFHADLSGDAERPDPVNTDASGDADLKFNSDTKELEVKIQHSLPAITMAHLHGPADRDGTAGVLHAFDVAEGEANDPITQTFTLTDEEETFLRDGLIYINLHTEEHPNGELRGQIDEGTNDDDDNTDVIIWVSVALGATAVFAVVAFIVFYKYKKSGSVTKVGGDVPDKAGAGSYKPQQDFA